jgi:hypothetical protein
MNTTDPHELTDREIYENQELGENFDRKYGMRMIDNSTNTNGTYANLKNAVFLAFVMSMAAIVWQQQDTNAKFREEIAVLKLECRNLARERTLNE